MPTKESKRSGKSKSSKTKSKTTEMKAAGNPSPQKSSSKNKFAQKVGNDPVAVPPNAGAVPAVPPPDNPQLRMEAEGIGVDDVMAAALRVEAIRRTREMAASEESPPDKNDK